MNVPCVPVAHAHTHVAVYRNQGQIQLRTCIGTIKCCVESKQSFNTTKAHIYSLQFDGLNVWCICVYCFIAKSHFVSNRSVMSWLLKRVFANYTMLIFKWPYSKQRILHTKQESLKWRLFACDLIYAIDFSIIPRI